MWSKSNHCIVMEDLRVLEQQQRDSQRLLASIKLTKQHKLEQRLSLETKLSTLKYSNGEARAQLQRARDVLSKSTRELGTAKLQSERSSENLKRFDNKLRQTLNHVRGLHSKRRQVEQAIAKLRNVNAMLSHREKTISEQIKAKEMEKDDAKHREKLLVKSIQASKRKVQEFVKDTIKMRSELSELESDLTISQQMEASTKFRVDTLKTEYKNEEKRHEGAKNIVLSQIKEINVEKMAIEKNIIDKSEGTELKLNALTQAFHRCVSLQKEDGFDVSTSPKSAALNIDGLRALVDGEELNLRVVREEESAILENISTIENQIKDLNATNERINDEAHELQENVLRSRETEGSRQNEQELFMVEFKKEQAALDELQTSVAQFKERLASNESMAAKGESEQKRLLEEARSKLEHVRTESLNVNAKFETKKAQYHTQTANSKQEVDEINERVKAKRTEFDAVQKLADDLKATSFDTHDEVTNIEAKGQHELNGLREEGAKVIEGE